MRVLWLKIWYFGFKKSDILFLKRTAILVLKVAAINEN